MAPVTVTVVPTWPDVGDRFIEGEAVTVNVAVAAAVPLAALTVAWPVPEDAGTAMVALNVPVDEVVTVAGVVGTDVPLNVIATVAEAG